jgi:hypothetical protein
MGLRCRLERSFQRSLTPQRDLDVSATGQRQHRARIDPDLPGVGIARDTGDGDQLDIVGADRIQQGEAVIDPGIDIQDEWDPLWHGAMLAEHGVHDLGRAQVYGPDGQAGGCHQARIRVTVRPTQATASAVPTVVLPLHISPTMTI